MKNGADSKQKWVPFWQNMLKPVLSLVVIGVLVSALLGVTNAVTLPIIENNNQAAAEAVRRTLLPQADLFEDITPSPLPEGISSVYKAVNGAGYIIEAYGRGYGGTVPATVAFGEGGSIVGVQFTENSETPGLGKKVSTEAWFASQFIGKGEAEISGTEVDKIASATISSNAALAAVNAAILMYRQEVGGVVVEALTPEEVRQNLLPGASQIAPLDVSAEGVEQAYKGDDGNYIIYAVANGFYSKPLTAAVALSPDGTILGLWLDTSNETEGYGAEIAKDQQFINQFVGRTNVDEVDVSAGATNSSNAAIQAIKIALAALPNVKGAE
ncbi:MAG: FMN-binding protein [Oscillospiraceae bacterium]